MPSFFPSFHVPKTRKQDAISAQDLQAPKNVLYDFDGSMAVDSYIPRKFSVKQMPELPAYDHRTGQISRGKRVQSTPHALPRSNANYRGSENYTYSPSWPEDFPPPVPQKEKRCSDNLIPPCQISSSLAKAAQISKEKTLLNSREVYLPEGPEPSKQMAINSYVPYNPYELYTTRGVCAHEDMTCAHRSESNADCGTIGLSLKQSSTFESLPNNDSQSTVDSKIYQLGDINPSYNSLIHVYLAEDSESCASCSSSVYESEAPIKYTPAQVRKTQLPPVPTSAPAPSYRPSSGFVRIGPSGSNATRTSAPFSGFIPQLTQEPVPQAVQAVKVPMPHISTSTYNHTAKKDTTKRRVQSESFNSTFSKNSQKSLDFCLDSGADYDKSRFWIPAGDRLQSKRYSPSQIRGISHAKLQSPESARISLDEPKKRASSRWSYAHPPQNTSHRREKSLPEIVVTQSHRHSTDVTTSGFNYKEKMMQTLQDTSRQNRASIYEKHASPRAVSNPILQIKQILRNSYHES